MQSSEKYQPVDWEAFEKQKKEDHDRYMKIKEDIKRTQEASEKTLKSLDNTFANCQKSIEASQDISKKFEDFKKQFGDALKSMAERIGQSISPAYKLAQKDDYQGPLPKQSTIEEVAKAIADSKNIIFLTGAGLSAASGIPTFRGKGGFWTSGNDTYEAQKVLTFEFFEKQNELCWNWHKDFQNILKNKQPNVNHQAIAKLHQYILENQNKLSKSFHLVTQNIDNLHAQCYKEEFQQFGFHKQIYEIHGNIKYIRCKNGCRDQGEELGILRLMPDLNKSPIPVCQDCGQEARPHILFFDEQYDQVHYRKQTVTEICEKADIIVVIGTKLETGLSSSIVSNAVRKGIKVIEVNPEPCMECGDILILAKNAEQVVPQICEQIITSLKGANKPPNQQKQVQTQQPQKQQQKAIVQPKQQAQIVKQSTRKASKEKSNQKK